jgi:hypothetical protein
MISTALRHSWPDLFFGISRYLMVALVIACFCLPSFATTAPTITPGSGVYASPYSSATITGDSGATFYYTTDGSTPTTSSTVYNPTTGVPLSSINTIKAVASLSGVLSTVTTALIDNDSSTIAVPRSGLVLWLKPEYITVSGSNVTQWTDFSGVGNNATQVTGANQPTLVSNSLFGYNGVSFNGTSSYLNLPSYLTNLTSGVSIFTMASPNTSSTAKTFITSSSSGTSDLVSLQTNGTTATLNANNGATTSSVTTPSLALTTGVYQEVDATEGANVGSITVNGISSVSGVAQNLNNIARPVNYIGTDNAKTSTSYWGGKVVEVLVYGRAVTVSERANIAAYLASRYQLANSIVTPVPIFSVSTSTLAGPSQLAIAAGPNATIYATQDGTTPTTASPVVTAPLNIYYTQTVKAIAVANGISSTVVSNTYTLDSTRWPAPSASDSAPLQINLQLPTTAVPQ